MIEFGREAGSGTYLSPVSSSCGFTSWSTGEEGPAGSEGSRWLHFGHLDLNGAHGLHIFPVRTSVPSLLGGEICAGRINTGVIHRDDQAASGVETNLHSTAQGEEGAKGQQEEPARRATKT